MSAELPPHPAEQLLIDALPEISAARILCGTLGRGQFAAAAARHGTSSVVCHELDVWHARQARESIGHSLAEGAPVPEVVVSADLPEGEFDLAAFPVEPRGEAELTRDLLQAACQRLVQGGRLAAATSQCDDQWLHAELRRLFPKVTRRPLERGVLYLATRHTGLKKVKQFECEFAFRDRDRLLRVISRPGVFSHRSLDAGARALINVMQILPGSRVIDLGCGSGAVAFAAAARAPDVSVMAIDSNIRAIDCTRRGAMLNELRLIETRLDAEGETGAPGTFDVVVANPPYYSDFRIAEIFVRAAVRQLKPGGRMYLVTKALGWYEEYLPGLFPSVTRHTHRHYTVYETQTSGAL